MRGAVASLRGLVRRQRKILSASRKFPLTIRRPAAALRMVEGSLRGDVAAIRKAQSKRTYVSCEFAYG